MASRLRVDEILPSVGNNIAIGTATGSVSFANATYTVGTGASVHSPVSNTLTLGTNDAERVRILSNGRVGIGTTNPGSLVDLYSDGPSITFKDSDDNSRSRIRYNRNPSGNSAAFIFECDVDDSNSAADVQAISFRVGGSALADEVVGITSTNLNIANGNLVFSSSGTGIDFQNAGISSTTATAHILDDYEEGTWTPSFNGYSTNFTGTYTKIGRKVTIKIERANSIPASTLTTGIRITGIPFAPLNGGGIADSTRSQFVSGMLSGRAPGSLGGGTAGAAIAPIAIINANGIDLYEQDTIWTTSFLPQNSNGDWIMPAAWQNGSTAIYIMWEFTYQTDT